MPEVKMFLMTVIWGAASSGDLLRRWTAWAAWAKWAEWRGLDRLWW